MKIYLHVGAGKCASSTLQNYFSHKNVTGTFAYVCLNNNGNLSHGDDVALAASSAPGNYAVSSNLAKSNVGDFLDNLENGLRELSKSFDTVLMSCEGWSDKADKINSFKRAFVEHEVSVIFIVRPPVQWMNSAWWQWFQWTPKDVTLWVKQANVAADWVKTYQDFTALDFIRKVHVLTLQHNILEVIGSLLGVEISDSLAKHNASSSSELLNFFKLNRALRPGPHDAQSEFILNKYLGPRSKADWVLSQSNVQKILNKSKKSCEELAKFIENENIYDNDFWWNVEAYAKNIEGYILDNKLSYSDLTSMLEESYEIIINLDSKLKNSNKIEGQVEELISIATSLEKKDLNKAYRLMSVVKRVRPNGPMIQNKINSYEKRLKII